MIFRLFRRFRKPDPHTATLELKPGVTNLRLTRDGEVVGHVILSEWSVDLDTGGTATFTSIEQWIQSRKFQPIENNLDDPFGIWR